MNIFSSRALLAVPALLAGEGGVFDPLQLALVLCRVLLPILAVWLVARCAQSLLRGRVERETWGRLTLPSGDFGEFHHWENTVGRSRRSDVVLASPTVSRSHAAFLRDEKGRWCVYALTAKNGTELNGRTLEPHVRYTLENGDVISLGGVEVTFEASTPQEEVAQARRRTRPGRSISPGFSLFLLTLVQLILIFELLCAYGTEHGRAILISFSALCLVMWGVYALYRILRRTGFEIETLAFFLTSLCLTVTANSNPGGLVKQLICVVMGLIFFFLLSILLRNLTLAKQLRWPVAIAAVVLLAFNLLLGSRLFGAKNWVQIGPISFQPSELVKLAFILVGATTLDRMFSRRNLIFTLLFSGFCVGCLGLMSDFGTALIFFATFLAIAFLRSGDLPSVAFMGSAAVFFGYIIIKFKPYIARRFTIYRHVWEDTANLGYQQSRTMAAIADGGLFGRGPGNGWLKNVAAANTDLVFGVTAQELGLILAVTAVCVILILAVFAVKSAAAARSTFYVIAACSTAMLLVVQTMLNVFGSVDLLPLTGVTFPFLSVGGSSMICCWGLLAFIKAADTRQNAGLAVRLPSLRAPREEEEGPRGFRRTLDPGATPEKRAPRQYRMAQDPEQREDAQPREFYPWDESDPPPEEDAADWKAHFQFPDAADAPADDPDLGSADPDPDESDADHWQDYFHWEEDDRP